MAFRRPIPSCAESAADNLCKPGRLAGKVFVGAEADEISEVELPVVAVVEELAADLVDGAMVDACTPDLVLHPPTNMAAPMIASVDAHSARSFILTQYVPTLQNFETWPCQPESAPVGRFDSALLTARE